MKHLKKVLPLIIILSLGLTACSDDEAPGSKQSDGRINLVVDGYTTSVAEQNITVEAKSNGRFVLRIVATPNGYQKCDLISVAVTALNGAAMQGDLLTQQTGEACDQWAVSGYEDQPADFIVSLPPGTYTVLQDGEALPVVVTVQPFGTTPTIPAPTAAPA